MYSYTCGVICCFEINKYIEMRETDQGAEESYGVFAKTNIKSNVVLTSFGDSKYLLGPDAKTMYSLIAKYNSASGPGDEKFQYTFSYHPPGHHEKISNTTCLVLGADPAPVGADQNYSSYLGVI